MALASVMVVEKDPIARERISRELRELGYSVGENHSGGAPPIPLHSLQDDLISAGGISIDIPGHRVVVDSVCVANTPREYRLLLFLINNQERVFSREQLLANVWDRAVSVGVRTVDVHVRRLRQVLEPFGYNRYLQTVRGSGYRFSVTKP